MIAVDTSALVAIAGGEARAEACRQALQAADAVIVSAATMAEALIVAGRRNLTEEIMRLFNEVDLDVVTVTEATARRVARAYDRWGKGVHPAGLNFGDCFAYVLAIERSCPLLYVGDDFAKTDVESALSG